MKVIDLGSFNSPEDIRKALTKALNEGMADAAERTAVAGDLYRKAFEDATDRIMRTASLGPSPGIRSYVALGGADAGITAMVTIMLAGGDAEAGMSYNEARADQIGRAGVRDDNLRLAAALLAWAGGSVTPELRERSLDAAAEAYTKITGLPFPIDSRGLITWDKVTADVTEPTE